MFAPPAYGTYQDNKLSCNDGDTLCFFTCWFQPQSHEDCVVKQIFTAGPQGYIVSLDYLVYKTVEKSERYIISHAVDASKT